MANLPIDIYAIGLYRSLTFVGIGLGVFLFIHGFNGGGIWPFFLILIGLFVTVKEIMDMMQYTSFMNLAGVGAGVLVLVLGVKGVAFSAFWAAALGAFIASKEVMDLLNSN